MQTLGSKQLTRQRFYATDQALTFFAAGLPVAAFLATAFFAAGSAAFLATAFLAAGFFTAAFLAAGAAAFSTDGRMRGILDQIDRSLEELIVPAVGNDPRVRAVPPREDYGVARAGFAVGVSISCIGK